MKNKKTISRKGIAIVVALVFMSAMLIISTTTATLATSIAKNAGDSYKSLQAYYYAESAVDAGLHAYKNGGDPASENTNSSYEVLGLTASLKPYDDGSYSFPLPGTGSAGKGCSVGTPVNALDVENILSGAFGVGQQRGDTALGEFGVAADYPCNWNKIQSTDPAIEIPLYGVDQTGQKVPLTFSDFKIRVRTACDEEKIKATATETHNTEEATIFNATGMCSAGSRYWMLEDPNSLKTVLNWGIYSSASDSSSYMVPPKEPAAPSITESDVLDWNITSFNINKPIEQNLVDYNSFVVLSGSIKSGVYSGDNKPHTISYALADQHIPFPFIRFTVEFPFPELPYFAGGTDVHAPFPIPNLEYQILYTGSGAGSISQFKGIPVIVGEGISGGFKHQIKMSIHETKTGFDYAYQKQ